MAETQPKQKYISHIYTPYPLIYTKQYKKKQNSMGRKGKTQKHTAKEIAAKHKAAKEKNGAAGGGGKGAALREAKKLATMIICDICKTKQPSVKSMALHYDSKHPKDDWNAAKSKYEAERDAKKAALMVGKTHKKDKKGGSKGTTVSTTSTKSAASSLASLSLGVSSQKKKGFLAGKKKKKKK
jgi:hypothetical protein